jgi:hypothetical protein
MNYRLIQLNAHTDARGKLISLEAFKNIPFSLEQMCFICNTTMNESGKERLIIAISGFCQFVLEYGEAERIDVSLARPDLALYTGKGIRCRLKTSSEDCKLLILSPDKDQSQYYG